MIRLRRWWGGWAKNISSERHFFKRILSFVASLKIVGFRAEIWYWLVKMRLETICCAWSSHEGRLCFQREQLHGMQIISFQPLAASHNVWNWKMEGRVELVSSMDCGRYRLFQTTKQLNNNYTSAFSKEESIH